MKLLLHVAFVFGILVGSDYAVYDGRNSRTLMHEASPKAVLATIHLQAHHTSEAMRRQVNRLVD
jgi:hypothetical protein